MKNKEGFLKYLFAANAMLVSEQDYVSCVLKIKLNTIKLKTAGGFMNLKKNF